jgi:Domain of unknown function (DUF1906)
VASTVQVVDFSFAHPTLTEMKAVGVKSVGRYLGQAMSEPKNLDAQEAQQLTAAGIDIVVIFEYAAQQALGGVRQATTDYALFESQAKAVGMPVGRPCYFAVDYDIPDYAPSLENTAANAVAKLGPLAPYFQYLRSKLGPDAGAYGGYWLIKRLFDANLISWGWQTDAWSGGMWDSRAQLRQTGATDWGSTADVDTPERTDYGQWHVGQTFIAPAAAPTKPAPPTLAEVRAAYNLIGSYLDAQ